MKHSLIRRWMGDDNRLFDLGGKQLVGKGIIIYQSKYGATKKYAVWLREMTGFACEEASKAAWHKAAQYETVIVCGGVYASGIAGLSFLRKNINLLKGRKVAVFAVGASPYDEKALDEIKAHNLKNELKDVPLYYGRGIWDESRMKFTDRTLCRMLQKSVAKKDPATYEPWMKALMCSIGKTCDWTDKKYLTPLLEDVH